MGNPIKHHYISKFYLKNFTKSGGSKENLFGYDKIKKNYFKSNPKDICFSKHFNTISFYEDPYIIERELAKVESIISVSFQKVIETKKYPNEIQLSHIIEFMALIALRNPKMRAIFDDFYKQVTNQLLMVTMSSEKIYLDQCRKAGIKAEDIIPYEVQKEFVLDKSRYTIEVNQEIHLQTEMGLLENLINMLYDRNWYMILSDQSIGEFITSDYPVSLISLENFSPNGVGFGLSKTEVCLPISKYIAFLGIFEEYDLTKIIYATKKIVEDINYRTFEFASKQVFSTYKLDFSLFNRYSNR